MEITEFWTICSANSIIFELDQIEMIKRFVAELKYWNQKVNLISRKDEDNILTKHILHSLTALKYLQIRQKANCLDLGCGGGLPGIPLKIARKDLQMLMIDSVGKKIKIASMFAAHTGLKNIRAMAVRAEDQDFHKDFNSSFDFIFSRAVARIDRILSWTDYLLKPDGKLVLYKGGNLDDEISEASVKYNFRFNEIPIDFFGFAEFKQEEKKLIIIQRS